MLIRLRHSAIFLFLFVLSFLIATDTSARTEAVSRYFRSSDGVRLHYLEVGQGPTLVFVPGWTMPAEIWEPQLRHFAKSFRVIAFDPRGQGKSDIARAGYTAERRARDIAELIGRLGEPVVLVSWSLGVLDSLAYVELAGTERLRALVLVDNSIGEEPPPVTDPTFLKRLRENRLATTERFVRGMYRTPQSEPYLRRIIAYSLRVPLDASVALLSYPYPRERWKEIVYRTHRPILYAVNTRFRGQAENLKKNRPDVWTEVFENAGHALFVDESERFNRLLEEFLLKEVRLLAGDGKKDNDS
jgi:microsomal epoxide hydrolase